MPATGSWEVRGGWVVRALMVDLDLKMENSAGLVGNLGGESGGFDDLQEKRPTVPGSAGGRGWAQWTGYSATNNRRKLFEEWCAQNGLDPDSDEGNYRYLVHELQTTERSALAKIRDANGLTEATRAAHIYYERSGDQSWSETNRRLVWAQRALTGAKDDHPAPSPAPEKPRARGNPAVVEGLVLVLQNYLVDTGYLDNADGRALDGLSGKNTVDALARFQRDHRNE